MLISILLAVLFLLILANQLSRMPRKVRASGRVMAEATEARAPTAGYYDRGPSRYEWHWVAVSLGLPLLLYLMAFASIQWTPAGYPGPGDPRHADARGRVAFGCAIVAAALSLHMWLRARNLARTVGWEEGGLAVTWYDGQVARLQWDDLHSLLAGEAVLGWHGYREITVASRRGRPFVLLLRRRSPDAEAAALVAALEAHVPADGVPDE